MGGRDYHCRDYICTEDENMNKKAGFDFQSYLIGLVLIVGIIVTFSAFYMDSAETYNLDTTTTQNFSDTYNKISELTDATSDLQGSSEEANLGNENAATNFYGSMIALIKIISSIYTVPIAIINGVGDTIGIPAIWVQITTLLIVILVVTTTLFMIFQGRGQ